MATIMNTTSNFAFTADQRKEIIDKAMEFLPKYEYRSGSHYEPTRYGLGCILDEYQANKGWLVDLFRKHPNYNGKGQIVLTEKYSRKTDYSIIGEFGYFIADLMEKHNEAIESSVPHNFKEGEEVKIVSGKGKSKLWFDGMDAYVGRTMTIAEDWADYNAYLIIGDGDMKILFDDYCFEEVRESGENRPEPFTKDQIRFFKRLPSEEYAIQFANEAFVELINNAFPWLKAHNGGKVSRLVNRVCKKYGFDKADGFTRLYTRFADAINPLQVTRYTILSVNIFDYWTMSFGKDWQSCHTIDKTNLRRNSGTGYSGCYSSGTESYMLDGSSFVVYIIDRDYTGDEFEFQDKLSRQMFHIGEDKLIQGRLYPQDNDTGAQETYKQIREVVQRVIAELYGVNNLWSNKRGTGICERMTSSYGTHYRDYTCYDNCNVSFLKYDGCEERNERLIDIGHDPICPTCGHEHQQEEYILCEDCVNIKTCERCGAEIRGDGVETNDGYFFCDSACAYEAGYVYCENRDAWFRESDEEVYYDEYTNEYFYDYYGTDHIITEDGRHYRDEYNAHHDGYYADVHGHWYSQDELYYCEKCDEYYLEDEYDHEHECCTECYEKESEVA